MTQSDEISAELNLCLCRCFVTLYSYSQVESLYYNHINTKYGMNCKHYYQAFAKVLCGEILIRNYFSSDTVFLLSEKSAAQERH